MYVVLNDIEPFCVENRAVCAALTISRFARSCSSLLLPSDLYRQPNEGYSRTSVLFVEGLMCDSLGSNIEHNKGE